MSQIVMVTGASSGIGAATARLFARHGYRVIACGRREERLQQLKQEFGDNIYPLTFEVRNREEVFTAVEALPTNWQNIGILINNAGNAHGLDTIQDGSPDDWDAMLDINVKGLLYVSKAVMAGMIERGRGHIINVGSIAGKEVYPKGNVYCASKHAVDALTRGMLIDLNPHGIKVSSIDPGLVETEFSEVRFKGDTDRAAQVYQGYKPLTATDVADVIYFMATRPPHVNISDLVLLPTAQASATIVKKS